MSSRLRKFRLASGVAALTCLIVAAVPVCAGPTPQAAPGPDQAAIGEAVVLADGRRLQLKCSGAGAPTVILDAGLGLDSTVWSRVRPELAAMTRTCAYDRAGYGASDPGPLPRDAASRASDLLGMLDATMENGPFVLVAHSAAGVTARLAAQQRPEIIAGIVLVDPGADLETLKAIGPVWAAAHDAARSAALRCIQAAAQGDMRPGNAIYAECGSPPADSPLASREMAAAVLSEDQSDAADVAGLATAGGTLGDVPLIVLTAENKFGPEEGAAPAETQPLRRAWSEAGAMIAATSSRGEQRIVRDASHVIQFEQPQAVIDAVNDVVKRARLVTVGDGPT